jgi:hypothetical protein
MPIVKNMTKAERILRAKLTLHGVGASALAEAWGIQRESAYLRMSRPGSMTLKAYVQFGRACHMDEQELADMVCSIMEALGYEQGD